jgi:hypothetical protein
MSVWYANAPANWRQAGRLRGIYCGAGTVISGASIADTAAIPNGTQPPYSWVIAIKGGGLATYNTIDGTGTLAAAMSMGKALEAALSGSGTISAASLAMIVQFAAALSGIGTVSSASMQLASALASALSGSGSISAASLALIVSLEADLAASGTMSGVMVGLSSMEADIIVTGDVLNTANVAAAVWGALAAFNDNAGSMGEQLNNAGASGNPWDSPIEGTYTAGKVSGAPTGPVVFRDINDTTDRVSATVDSSGNRTAVVLDEA